VRVTIRSAVRSGTGAFGRGFYEELAGERRQKDVRELRCVIEQRAQSGKGQRRSGRQPDACLGDAAARPSALPAARRQHPRE